MTPSDSARAPIPAAVAAQVDKARDFLRRIRAGIAGHPVAARQSRIVLQERRSGAATVLRLSGTLDGVLVSLHVEILDALPQHAQMDYSRSLERLRDAAMLTPAASAFAVAHDRALQDLYPERGADREALRLALEQYTQGAARGVPVH